MINDEARKCKHCGELLEPELREAAEAAALARARPEVIEVAGPPQRLWSPGVAAVLSFFFPGVGQMYKGQILNGFVWMAFIVIGYVCLIIPGLILHLCCILGAASGDPYKRR
jgi:hypothetical protein